MFKLIFEFIRKELFSMRTISTKIVWLCSSIYIILFVMKLATGLFGFEMIYNKIIYNISLSTDYHELLKKPWSIISYVFVNTNLWRLFWSLLSISYFSNLLVYLTDYNRLIKVYFVGIIGGAILVMFFNKFIPKFSWYTTTLIGMDSLCYALITAATVIAPNYLIGLLFLREVKLKYVLFCFLIMALYFIDSGSYVGVAQLGGSLFVYIYMKIIYGGGKIFKKVKKIFSTRKNFHRIDKL